MSSSPSISRRSSVSARFATSKQTWWNPSPFDCEEPGDAGRVVGRLDQLDLGLPHPEERDAHPVLRDVHDRLQLEAQRVAPEPERRLDRGDDERHVVDLAEPADRERHGRGRAASALLLTWRRCGRRRPSAAYAVGAMECTRRSAAWRSRSRSRRGLAAIRDRWDFAAAQGAQPHVTVLFPFLPASALTDDVRAELAADRRRSCRRSTSRFARRRVASRGWSGRARTDGAVPPR